MEKKFTKNKVTMRLGTVGDLVTEYMTPEETKAFWEDHNKYVEELKKKGDYLKKVEITFEVEHDPFYDEPKKKPACESYRYEIFDMKKLELKKTFDNYALKVLEHVRDLNIDLIILKPKEE